MITAIIQARVNSSRLPGKVLCDIAGRPMLWQVVQRVRQARRIDNVVVATSNTSADDALAQLCDANKISCFRGSETDVLDRFYQAATRHQADVIVRITGDCPLIDPHIIDRVVDRYLASSCDYAANSLNNTYPDGLDVEVFSLQALERAWSATSNPIDREHVTAYFTTSGQFRIISADNEATPHTGALRWTVDDEKDLQFVRAVYDSFSPDVLFFMDDIVALLDRRPDIRGLNAGTIRNEGYYLSICQEKETLPVPIRSLKRTRDYLERSRRLIPSQTQTFSKGPTQWVQGVSPAFLVRGEGSRVWDVDGNSYIDYVSGLGPVILGYDHPAVTDAVMRQVKDGASFSLPHYLEVDLAELLVEILPCAEMVRFGKNGSDVTAGAVRVARGYTRREKIACCGYHGWQDWYIGTTTRRLGVPRSTQQLTLPFEYNNIASLETLFREHPGEIAAVIMEAIGVIEPADHFLQKVKDVAHRHGAVLIFDEVVTGFRLGLTGAQGYYGVTPDIACFGKAMANGFPLSAVVGRRDIMQLFDEVFFSFTFGGEAVSLAAAVATIGEMQRKDVFPHLWAQGQKLKDGYNVIAREVGLGADTQCIGLAPHTVVDFNDTKEADGLVFRSLVQQEMIKRGVLFLAGFNLTFSHSDADVEHTLRALRDSLTFAKKALSSGHPQQYLASAPVQEVIRRAG